MTIATTAPEKYRFQDLVCVDLALRFESTPGVQLLVEPTDGEDAQLVIPAAANGAAQTVEVQVKGAGGAVSLAEIAACLAHFPPRESTNCLLERLLSDPARMALLVMTARCDDKASPYVVDGGWDGHPPKGRNTSREQAEEFLRAFEFAEIPGKPGSDLRVGREARCRKLAGELSVTEVRAALDRVLVWERVTAVDLEARCDRVLRSRHRIPSVHVSDVIARMRDVVNEAKKCHADAVPMVAAAVQASEPESLRPIEYSPRGTEQQWLAVLTQKNALLLSGVARCGKSDAARWVASELQTQGYEVRVGSDIDTAVRFLRDPRQGHLVFLLDDPLGASQPLAQVDRSIEGIRTLIPRLGPHRMLIIAQREDVLLQALRQQRLVECDLAGCSWTDLGDLAPEFLGRVWTSVAESEHVPAPLLEIVRDALLTGRARLEPGCLRYLASFHGRLDGDLSLDAAMRLAREDAKDIGRSLVSSDPEMEPILATLAIASAPAEPVGRREFAFVTGSGGDRLPGLAAKWSVVSLGGDDAPYSPEYESTPQLSLEVERRIEVLERRRLVETSALGALEFSHPLYRAAAEWILSAPTERLAGTMVAMLRRGLFCLSPVTSRASARNLGNVFRLLQSRPSARSQLSEIAADGLRSIFLSTRDLCYGFLVERLAEWPEEMQRNLPSWASAIAAENLRSVVWMGGNAAVAAGEASAGNWIEGRLRSVERDDVRGELSALEGESTNPVTPERAAEVLQYYSEHPASMTLRAFERLLSFDEAVIRGEAVKLWLSLPRDNDGEALGRVFADPNPGIALATLRGAIAGWPMIDSARRGLVVAGIQDTARSPGIAAVLMDNLILFDRVEYTGKNPPWPLFASVLPTVMRSLPRGASFVEARLFNVAQEAIESLAPEEVMAICEAWLGWLERECNEGSLPSEFSLSVADVVLEATNERPELRNGVIERLLGFQSTGPLIAFLRDCIDRWGQLTGEERAAVLRLLAMTRPDSDWLRALAATRSSVPPEIQHALFGSPDFLAREPEQIVVEMPSGLLAACIAVFTGAPQPLGWLGVHHARGSTWSRVLSLLARSPSHALFEAAFVDAVGLMNNERVIESVRACVPDHLGRAFDLLLRLKVAHTGNWQREAWTLLLNSAPDETVKTGWLDRMAESASAVLDRLSDIRDWVPEHAIDLLRRLRTDIATSRAVEALDLALRDDPQAVDGCLQALAQLLRTTPPRLFGSCDMAREVLKKVGGDRAAAAAALVNEVRTAIFEERGRLKDGLKWSAAPPRNWISP